MGDIEAPSRCAYYVEWTLAYRTGCTDDAHDAHDKRFITVGEILLRACAGVCGLLICLGLGFLSAWAICALRGDGCSIGMNMIWTSVVTPLVLVFTCGGVIGIFTLASDPNCFCQDPLCCFRSCERDYQKRLVELGAPASVETSVPNTEATAPVSIVATAA
jgi:hypothetical protein